MTFTTKPAHTPLPKFAELAAIKISHAGPRDKTINIKVAINTARMMVVAETRSSYKPNQEKTVNAHADLIAALKEVTSEWAAAGRLSTKTFDRAVDAIAYAEGGEK